MDKHDTIGIDCVAMCVNAVSYTHLDVYKRQTMLPYIGLPVPAEMTGKRIIVE